MDMCKWRSTLVLRCNAVCYVLTLEDLVFMREMFLKKDRISEYAEVLLESVQKEINRRTKPVQEDLDFVDGYGEIRLRKGENMLKPKANNGGSSG